MTPPPRTPPLRDRKLFLAALALEGLTMTEWATQQGVTCATVSQVLAGIRRSVWLAERIARFARRYNRALARRA